MLFALIDYKRAVIIWMPLRLLFNNQIALRYSSPGIALTIGVDAMLVVMFFAVAQWQRRYNFNTLSFPFRGPFVALVVSYSFSLMVSNIPMQASVIPIIKYFLTGMFITYVFFKVLESEDDIKLYLRTTVIVVFLISINGLVEAVIRDNIVLDWVYYNTPHTSETYGRMFYNPESPEMRYGQVRARSFFGFHIPFAVACTFLFYLFSMQIKLNRKHIKTIVLYLCSVLLVASVVVANSKTGYVSLAILLIGFVKLRQVINFKVLIPVFIGFWVLVKYFPEYLNNFFSLTDEEIAHEGRGSTVAMRLEQFDIAKQMWSMNYLLGNGPGSIAYLKNEFYGYTGILGAESIWLSVLPERGLLGGAVVLYMYWNIFAKFRFSIPLKSLLVFILCLMVMETASGVREMYIYGPILLLLKRQYELNQKR